jgi:hypothetical protein
LHKCSACVGVLANAQSHKASQDPNFFYQGAFWMGRFTFLGGRPEVATPAAACADSLIQKTQMDTPQVRICEYITYARSFFMD